MVGKSGTDNHGIITGGDPGTKDERLAPIESVRLLLNGHERQAQKPGNYHNKVVPFRSNKVQPDVDLYLWSFALAPLKSAPSGSLNLSRIDSAILAHTFKKASESNVTTVLMKIRR